MATRPGPLNAITDIAGLSVGQTEDDDIVTGVTVILADEPVLAAVNVMGGGPGTRETDLLRAGTLVDHVDGVVLSGGSAFGLGAADGVAEVLKQRGRGFSLVAKDGVPPVPILPSAILYDLANGGNKSWSASPYPTLGARATETASRDFRQGRFGAGRGARAGTLQGGIGSASFMTEDGYTVGAIVAVNCFGSVLIPGTDAFWAWPFEQDTEFGGQRPPADTVFDAEDWGAAKTNPSPGTNTTIACIATDAALSHSELQRVAEMAGAGLARAIRPVFAPFDGDTIFALATGACAVESARPLVTTRIGELAAATLARAIARGVHTARLQEGAQENETGA
jgi:L-aminopeptidase/D-esterase-like protein